MKVYTSLQHAVPVRGSAVTIGIFDGVHLGHKKIIAETVKRAKSLGLKSALVTFNPHPLKVIHPERSPKTFIALEHKSRLGESLGIDILVILNFTRPLSMLSPRRFVEKFLAKGLKAREVIVGRDFRFGTHKKGDIDLLKALGRVCGFSVRPIDEVKVKGVCVSSSLIRSLITRGDLDGASRLLGRRVSILGAVVHGSKIGRRLGYPTANIKAHHEAIPPSGVYAVKVRYKGENYKGVLNIGFRPTVTGPDHELKDPTIEVHIFNFEEKNIYGEDIEVLFIKKLRDEKHFSDVDALANEIRKDITTARRL